MSDRDAEDGTGAEADARGLAGAGLPTGWARTTLGEIAQPSRRRTLPASADKMRYVGLEHIEPHTMKILGHGETQDVRSSSFCFSQGDVLYGRLRPYLNKVWVAEFDGLCSSVFV